MLVHWRVPSLNFSNIFAPENTDGTGIRAGLFPFCGAFKTGLFSGSRTIVTFRECNSFFDIKLPCTTWKIREVKWLDTSLDDSK